MTKKISQLTAASSVSAGDIVPIVQSGTTKQATVTQLLASVPHKPQIVTTRCGIFNSIRQGTAGSRTDVRIENREEYYVGNQAVSQLRVAQPGFYLKNDATAEHIIGNEFTWEAAIEITSPTMYQELFSQGTNLPVIQGSQGIPLVISDPVIGIDIAAGGAFFLRQAVSVSSDTLYIPTSSNAAASSDSGSISPSTSSQIQATGTITNPSGGTGFGGPQAVILGIPAAPMASVCFVGDSLSDGTGDASGPDAYGNLGFIARGLNSVNGYPVPWLRETVGGDQFAENTIDKAPRKRSLWPYVTHIVFALGTNDINSNNASLATMQGYLNGLLTAAKRTIGPYGKPLQTAAVTIMPRTTSTDSWATAANQTVQTNMGIGGVRDTYNAWLPTIVGGGLLDAVIDVNPYVEDQAHLSKWITNGSANYPTTDGTHPTTAFHILAATAINNWALTIVP